LGFFLPVAPVLARFRVAMRCRRVGNTPVFLPGSAQNPLFSPFDLWLADARPLDFMRVSGRWLGGNCTDQNHCKPVLRINFIKQRVLLVPIRRQQIVLQPDQTQGFRLVSIEDAAHHIWRQRL
jgi:hypothetical protein